MLTFNNFIENQSVKSKFEEIATLIAENQVDPNVLIKAWFDENEPEMSVYLTEAGFWDGIKQAGSAAWQGMKQGVQNFNRAYSGPESYYNSAVDSLQKLSNYVHNDPFLSKNYSRFLNNVNGILSDLKANRGDVPVNNNGNWTSQNNTSFSNVMNAAQNQASSNAQQVQAPQQARPQQAQAQQTSSKSRPQQVSSNAQQVKPQNQWTTAVNSKTKQQDQDDAFLRKINQI